MFSFKDLHNSYPPKIPANTMESNLYLHYYLFCMSLSIVRTGVYKIFPLKKITDKIYCSMLIFLSLESLLITYTKDFFYQLLCNKQNKLLDLYLNVQNY